MQVIVLYCLLCSSLCLSLQEYSRPYVYVYVHSRLRLRLRLRPPGRDRARTLVEQNRNTQPEHTAKPQALAHRQMLGQQKKSEEKRKKTTWCPWKPDKAPNISIVGNGPTQQLRKTKTNVKNQHGGDQRKRCNGNFDGSRWTIIWNTNGLHVLE